MGISTKKFLIVVLSLTLLFLVSCGDRPTGSGSEKKLSNYAGVYEGGGQKITINSNGSIDIDGQNIPANSITQNGNTFSFDIDGVKYSLTFNSDTEVECTKNGTQIPLTKKPESGGGGSSGNDIDNQINALFDKFPKPSTAPENAVNDNSLNGNYKSDGNLTLFPDETEVINYYDGSTKEDFIKNDKGKIGFLDIASGKATGYVDDKSEQGKFFENAQIYKNNSSEKYYAVAETKSDDGSNNFYIEFNKDDSSGNLTSFKIMRLVRANRGGYNYAVQQTYTGTLIKDTSSGN